MGRIYRLDKIVLKITKADKLLANVTSNTLDKSKNALLDRFGRIVVTFEQLWKDDILLVVIASKFYDRLMDALKMYIKLTKAEVTKTGYKVYFDLDSSHEGITVPQNRGQLLITEEELESNISEEEFTSFRAENNIPLHGIDYDDEMLLNVSEDYVDYDKGCFLGQEIIARVHYKSKPPKKLVASEDNRGFEFIPNK